MIYKRGDPIHMKSKCMVSAIVPVYNEERYIAECLDSLLKQTMRIDEIICINDASTDQSSQIIKDYAIKNDNIYLLENLRNKGLSFSRNLGIANAHGDYLFFIDSDDVAHLDAIEQLYSQAEKHDTDLVYFDLDCINENGCVEESTRDKFLFEGFSEDEVFAGHKAFINMIDKLGAIRVPGCCQFVSAKFIERNHIRFVEGIIHEDIIFTTGNLLAAKKVAFLNKKLISYRKHPEPSLSTNVDSSRSSSVFFSFMYFLELWSKSSSFWSDDFNAAFRKHLINIFNLYLSIRERVPRGGVLPTGNDAAELLFDLVEKGSFMISNHISFNQRDIDLLRTANKVYIYGAGVFGAETVNQLKHMGFCISNIFVSDLSKNPSDVSGIEVKEYRKELVHSEDVVVIGIRVESVGGLIKKLKRELSCNIIIPENYG